jgi:hypothetical protein
MIQMMLEMLSLQNHDHDRVRGRGCARASASESVRDPCSCAGTQLPLEGP